MTTKEQIIQELDGLPESLLPQALEVIRQLKQSAVNDDPAWQTYLEIEQEDEQVFKRLVDA